MTSNTEKLLPMTQDQWDVKLRMIAIKKASEHNRPADLWFLYTPEAVTLMKRTWYLDVPDFEESMLYGAQSKAELTQ